MKNLIKIIEGNIDQAFCPICRTHQNYLYLCDKRYLCKMHAVDFYGSEDIMYGFFEEKLKELDEKAIK